LNRQLQWREGKLPLVLAAASIVASAAFLLSLMVIAPTTFLTILVYAIVLLILLGCLIAILQRPIRVVYILIIWIFVQDLAILLLSHLVANSDLERLSYLVILGKEALLGATFVYVGIRRGLLFKHWTLPDWLAVALSAWIALYLVLPSSVFGGVDVPFIAKLTSARSYLVFTMLYLVGRWVSIQIGDLKRAARLFFAVALMSFAVGLFLTAMPGSMWQAIGIREFFQFKVGERATDIIFMRTDLPGNFYFPDLPASLVPYPGVRRMSSTIIEPITTGLVFASLFLMAVALSKRHRLTPRILVFGVAALLAFGRGGILLAGVGYLFIRLKKPALVIFAGAMASVLVLLLYKNVLPIPTWGGGTALRLNGMVDGILWTINHPLGIGLGTSNYLTLVRSGGANARGGDGLGALRGADFPSFSSEIFVNTLGTQTGLFGTGLFLAWLFSLIRKLFIVWRANERSDFTLARMALAMSGAMAGLLLLSFMSSSGYGFVGVGMSFLFSGLAINGKKLSRAV